MLSRRLAVFAMLYIFIPFSLFAQEEDFIGWFLTWKEDPSTTMVVDWHSFSEEEQTLYFKPEGGERWQTAKGSVMVFPHSEPQRWIHRVALDGLDANTKYLFKVEDNGKEYYFRTMPERLSDRAIRVAMGGDTMHGQESMERTNRQAMVYQPDMVVIGGDLAYADGDPNKVDRWYQWFEAYNNTLIDHDGRVVPMVLAIGNHEVQKGSFGRHEDFEPTDASRERIAPFFFGLFAFPGQPGYGVLDFGKYLSLVLLDTQHANAIEGTQTQWLEETLAAREDVLHVFPVYHVPAFPSVRNYEGEWETMVRRNFVPLFEKHGVRLAFENHDHAYKRTFPVRGEEKDEAGVVYFGDGSWGTSPRDIHNVEETWYLNKAQSIRAFTIVSIEGRQVSVIAVDENGRIIDSYPENPVLRRE